MYDYDLRIVNFVSFVVAQLARDIYIKTIQVKISANTYHAKLQIAFLDMHKCSNYEFKSVSCETTKCA